MLRESAKTMAEQAVRIVGWRRMMMLSASLAAIVVVLHPAGAQTVVGGDGRPAVVVDRSVLDQLGPQPTLPDLLLGRQPAPVATRPVTLHRPHAKAGVALVKPS